MSKKAIEGNIGFNRDICASQTTRFSQGVGPRLTLPDKNELESAFSLKELSGSDNVFDAVKWDISSEIEDV